MSVSSESQATFVLNVKDKFKGNTITIPASVAESRLLLILVDAVIVLLAARGGLMLAQMTLGITFNPSPEMINWVWFVALVAGWWVLAWFNDLYDIPSSTDARLTVTRVVLAISIGLLIYGVSFFAVISASTRFFIGYFLLLGLLLLMMWRWTRAKVFSMASFRQRVIIVGSGERSQSIARALKQSPLGHYQIIGYAHNKQVEPGVTVDGVPVLGQEADLPRLVEKFQIHKIIVAKQKSLENDSFRYLIESQARGAQIALMPDLYAQLYRCIPIEHIDPNWALQAIQGQVDASSFQQGIKRLIDICLAIVGLIILLSFLPLLALIIYIDSPGPIFYRQIRCGRAGKPFSIIKLRSMRVDAEQDGKARWARKHDPRITRVGYYLRKTRLDELPQLFNVLRGDMSIIGPRPERPEFVRELQQEIPFYQTRLMVKPGLSGWAQVHYNYGNSVEDALIKLRYDFYYMRYWSLWMDFYIIFRTISVVLKFKGT